MKNVSVALMMTVVLGACASNSAGTDNDRAAARAAYEEMPIASLTSAPRRVSTQVRLERPVKEVWAYLGDHKNLLEYSDGVLGKVSVDGSLAEEVNGVGTRRRCETSDGKGQFVESIVYFKAPYAFAYSATENNWGLNNHLATVSLRPDGKGGTIVQWDQYFNHVQPNMAPKVAANIEGMLKGKILAYLANKFGGRVL